MRLKMKYISIQIQIMENLEIFIKILIYEIQTPFFNLFEKFTKHVVI